MPIHLTVPAAEYLRMSTEHQQYSLSNQSQALHKYAEINGFQIVQTYTDAARSGVVLRHREGLRQLLNDVVSGKTLFKVILVYDVSRWGRFQDSDESAHYEFLCRSAGIPVHYCAEPFTNDGTPLNSLLKTIKRTMAAEYSRELGVKCKAGQRNVLLHGFRGCGALAGYALRRMLVSPDGIPKQLLAEGEHKALQTDRIILVPGPPEEVAALREIYRLFIEEKHGYLKIATILNENRVPYLHQRPWNLYAIKFLLTNTKYNGAITYGKVTRSLHTKSRNIPESQWLCVPHPTAKLIDDATFEAARARIKAFTINKSNEQLLDELRSILATNGKISSTIVRRIPGATQPTSIRGRFGSFANALQLIGCTPAESEMAITRRRVKTMRMNLMLTLQKMFPDELTIHGGEGMKRNWLQLADGTRLSVRFCIQPFLLRRTKSWALRLAPQESDWVTLVALLNRENSEVERLLVYPRVPHVQTYLRAKSPWLMEGTNLNSLRSFCDVVRKVIASPR